MTWLHGTLKPPSCSQTYMPRTQHSPSNCDQSMCLWAAKAFADRVDIKLQSLYQYFELAVLPHFCLRKPQPMHQTLMIVMSFKPVSKARAKEPVKSTFLLADTSSDVRQQWLCRHRRAAVSWEVQYITDNMHFDSISTSQTLSSLIFPDQI